MEVLMRPQQACTVLSRAHLLHQGGVLQQVALGCISLAFMEGAARPKRVPIHNLHTEVVQQRRPAHAQDGQQFT